MTVRKPTCTVNGIAVDEAEIHINRYQSASAFSCTFSMKALKANGGSVSQWTDHKQKVTIEGSNDGQGSKKLFEGETDVAHANWNDQTVRVEGRCSTGKLIDATTDPKKHQFKNKTAEDIVRELAGEKGLSVETGGGGGGSAAGGAAGGGGPGSGGAASRAGRKHVKEDYDFLTGQESYWNVIRTLAEREGKMAWVDPSKNVLHFESHKSGGGGGGGVDIRYRPSSGGPPEGNFVELLTTINFGAEAPQVTVSSWHTRDKRDNSSDGGGGGAGGESGKEGFDYKYEYPGLTKEQSSQIKESKTKEHGRHFKQLRYLGPGDVTTEITMKVKLDGTGTVSDDSYDMDSLRFIFEGTGSEFTMTIEAKTGSS
jgi:hypothetical protein